MLPDDENLDQLDFVDVGCGSGELLIYASMFYPFRTAGGIEVDSLLVMKANENLEKIFSNNLDLEVGSLTSPICMDASNHRMKPNRTLFFMFNPFGWKTARRWLTNNLETLRETGSYLAISNDVWAKELVEFGPQKNHERNGTYNLSLFRF